MAFQRSTKQSQQKHILGLKKEEGGRTTASPLRFWMRIWLELVAQRHLQDARNTRRGSDDPKLASVEDGGRGRPVENGVIESVERIKAEYELLTLRSWYFQGFPKSHVHGREIGTASGVAGSRPTAEGKSYRGDSCGLAGEVLQSPARIRMDSGLQP